ncbi:MAG: PAS domain-containing sensor histidine kinase [Pseudomonadota bacterium]|nr:PAS domain-containing sensor histidine kinase [Pseudomonadota bacterium]
MKPRPDGDAALVKGVLDAHGRLVSADPALAGLHARAGGREGGMLAVPQIAALARLARTLGITISRGAIAADGACDLDLWVRAEPVGEGVALAISGWTERPAYEPQSTPPAARERDIARAAADWVWEADEALRLTLVGPGATAALGKASAELIGAPLTALFRFREQEDGSLPILTALAERRRFEAQVAELRTGSGEAYLLSGIPLIDGAGAFAGFRGSAMGIAAALRDRAANDPSPAPEPLSVFGERLDKALRDPLDHIIAHAETIGAQGDGPLQADYAGYAADIASAGRHLLSLVDDLVDLQGIERPGFAPLAEPLDLAQLARQAAQFLALRGSDRPVRIDAPGEGDTLPATGEYRRVLQILVNLITNAIRYTPEGAAVRVSCERRAGLAAVIVVDSGKGIAPGDHARIFEKFERVDPSEAGGTGLGLYIARRLARAMGGDITVESALGQGASFTLTLPAR